MKYCTTPDLIIYPNDSGFVVEVLKSKREFQLTDVAIIHVLNAFKEPLYIEEAVSWLSKLLDTKRDDIHALIGQMMEAGVIVPESCGIDTSWARRNWTEAYQYFLHTVDFPFLDYGSERSRMIDRNLMKEFIEQEPVPPIYKIYPTSKHLSLPEPNSQALNVNVADLMSRPVIGGQNRRFIDTLEDLSTMLFFVFGKSQSIAFPVQGEFVLKHVPSGGARHPTEAYVIPLSNHLVESICHYDVQNHALVTIGEMVETAKVKEAIPELKRLSFAPKILIVMTSMVERSMWRYRESRTYRVLLHDIGHLVENGRLIANALNIHIFSGQGFRDSALESLLGVDELREPAMRYLAL